MSEVVYAPQGMATASLDDLLAVDDMPTATVHVERWKQAVKLKGPNLPQMVAIMQQARRKDPLTGDIIRDLIKHRALSLMYCMVEPKLDEAQATLLVKSKNPIITEALVNFCWEPLLNISLDELAAIVADASGTPMGVDDDDAGDPDRDLPV